MSKQKPLIVDAPQAPARVGQCWLCAVDLEEIVNGWGTVIARRCNRCGRLTPTGKSQPTAAPKLR